MLKKTFLLFSFMILLQTWAAAQIQIDRPQRPVAPPEEERWTDRLIIGGGFGLSFYDGWYINLSPTVGYKVTDRLWAGIGLDYYYRKDNFYDIEYSIIGPKAYTLYFVLPQVNLGAEFAEYFYTGDARDRWGSGQTRLLLGGGYNQFFGNGKGGIRLELYYDVLYNSSDDFNFIGSAFEPRINVFFGL